MKRMEMRERMSVLRRGLARVCAVLLGGAASAAELGYSGEVYRYVANTDAVYEEARYKLDDASCGFDLSTFPARFSSAKVTYRVAVPVTLKSGSVKAENVAVSLEGVVHSGELSAAKVYDDRAFMKMVCPADTSKWEDWYDGWGYEDDSEHREWPKDVWPGKTPVSGRYWVLTQLNGAIGNWSGLTHLKIEVRDDVNGSFDPVVVPLGRQEMVDLPGDTFFGGSSMTVKPLPKCWWVKFREVGHGEGWFWLDYEDHLNDELELPIDVREAGVLKVVYGFEWPLMAQGRNVVSSRDVELDWSTRCLEVEVSAATTLTVRNDEGEAFIREISFWPSGSRCVRVVADDEYVELCDHDKSYLRGYVLGSGVYKSGETATLTAVAGNTAAFVRWESDEIELDPAAATNAHLSFTVPDAVCAAADARAEVRVRAVWRDRLPGEGGSEPSEPGESGIESSYGPFVPGEPVSIDLPALVGYKAKGLPAGLKLDAKTGRIAGAAKKPTGKTGATVTFTKKGAPTLWAQFVVGPVPVVSVECAGDAEGCKVTGAGKAYLAGKKVTLAAKAPKGTAFTGWTRDGAPWPDAGSARQAKVSFTMPAEDVTLVASFERERMSVACPSLASMPLTVGVAGDTEGYPLEIETQSGVKSVKAMGLPSGMKLAKDRETGAWRIVGAPKRAGTYEVALTVTAVSGAQEKVLLVVEVMPLPAWAVGTFVGDGGNYYDEFTSDAWPCSGTFTVSANGKVAGKVVFVTDDGRLQTASFSAPALTGYDAEWGEYYCDVVIAVRDGRGVVSNRTQRLYIMPESYDGDARTVGYACIDEEGLCLSFGQNVWKVKGFGDLPSFAARKTVVTKTFALRGAYLDNREVVGTSTLTLEIDSNGTVSATFVDEGGDDGQLFLAKKSAAKGDLIVERHAQDPDSYGARVSLALKGIGVLEAEVSLDVSADGKVHADGCEITRCFVQGPKDACFIGL